MRVPRFRVGSIVAVALISFANVYGYFVMPESSTIDDGFVVFGWPFSIYAYGGFWTHSVIIWTGLIGNVASALCVGRVLNYAIEMIAKNRVRLPNKMKWCRPPLDPKRAAEQALGADSP